MLYMLGSLKCGQMQMSDLLCEQDVAHYDFAFEDVVSKPHEQMRILAQQLGLEDQVRST